MTRVALDSNVLVYAELEPETAKGKRCRDLIGRAAVDGVVPAQVLGEFLRVVQRRVPKSLDEALKQVVDYGHVFATPPTTHALLADAAEISLAHGLQFWDAVVCTAASVAGARILLTEDLQDGRRLGKLLILNPFSPKNQTAIDAAL